MQTHLVATDITLTKSHNITLSVDVYDKRDTELACVEYTLTREGADIHAFDAQRYLSDKDFDAAYESVAAGIADDSAKAFLSCYALSEQNNHDPSHQQIIDLTIALEKVIASPVLVSDDGSEHAGVVAFVLAFFTFGAEDEDMTLEGLEQVNALQYALKH